MAREDLHFRLRIPDHLKGQIEESASANRRSMTAEIIARLEESFGGEVKLWDDVNTLRETVAELEKALQDIGPKVKHLWEKSEP